MSNIILYGSGLFGRNLPAANQTQLLAIQNSGFTTVILWSLHVWNNGDLVYNNSVIATNGEFVNQYSYLPDLINQMKTGGTVTKVLISIGSGGASDFAAIQTLLSTPDGERILQKNFGALVTALPIDGFDFDLEEAPLCNFTTTVVNLALMLNNLFGMEITFCPYYNPPCGPNQTFWENCLAQIYQRNNNTQIVSWYNLQCYAGGSSNNPITWVQTIQNYPQPLGIANPAAFVIPGYWCANPGTNCAALQMNGVYCPSGLQQQFNTLAHGGGDPGIDGGFIWNSADIFSCADAAGCAGESVQPQDYAGAIINGLAGPG
ncbi:MAG TPA: hypothetical protein VHI13_19975 [Candidatus Kapabacteria bacterium]|nr:hypothetical protein [Candidatus Kapabacteria bacterium]